MSGQTINISLGKRSRPPFECIALVLQGGGALGAYQAGVYEALAEAGLHPDWVAGISIGAINASIIAGNPRNIASRSYGNSGSSLPPLANRVGGFAKRRSERLAVGRRMILPAPFSISGARIGR